MSYRMSEQVSYRMSEQVSYRMSEQVSYRMSKKYELTDEVKGGLRRIRALKDIKCFGVRAGDCGGYVESEDNLSQDGNAWLHDDAWAFGDAKVYGDALLSGNAQAYGSAKVYGNARVYGNAQVSGYSQVYDNASVFGDAFVFGHAQVSGGATVYGYTKMSGDACIKSESDYCVFTHVGSKSGTLTVYKGQSGALLATRGCFSGTLDAFEAAVNKNSIEKIQKEYALLIAFARLRLGGVS